METSIRVILFMTLMCALVSTGCWRSFGTEENEATCYIDTDCPPGQVCSDEGTCQCDAASCAGCCGDDGRCHRGDTTQACGSGGEPCVRCTGEEMACVDGACRIESCDECPSSGAMECTPGRGERAYRLCDDTDGDGCLNWRPMQCGSDERCDDVHDLCVEQECYGIPDPCPLENEKACREGSIDVFRCTAGDNGCLSWHVAEECGENEPCWNGTCAALCEEQCDPFEYPRCRDDDPYHLFECEPWDRPDAEMCVSMTACPPDQICTANGLGTNASCSPECPDECLDEGATMCTFGGEIRSCVPHEKLSGEICLIWSDPEPCEGVRRCPAGHDECCIDMCSTGEVDCNGNTGLMWECVLNEETGCYNFDRGAPPAVCNDTDPSIVCVEGPEGTSDGCVDVCPEECEDRTLTPYCDGPVRHYCGPVSVGSVTDHCWTWMEEDCSALGAACLGGYCIWCTEDTPASCSAEGEITCRHDMASGRDQYRVCARTFGDCLMWSEWRTCEGGEVCNDDLGCDVPCVPECDPGEGDCVNGGGAMLVCVTIDGCDIWSPAILCDPGWACDPGIGMCVPPPVE